MRSLIDRDRAMFKLSKNKNSIKSKKFSFVDEEDEIRRKHDFNQNKYFMSHQQNSEIIKSNDLLLFINCKMIKLSRKFSQFHCLLSNFSQLF